MVLSNVIVREIGLSTNDYIDNGRQFVSSEFDEYCKMKGITLNLTIPYWPQQNGEVERQNRSLLKRLQISHSLGRDWKKDIEDYLCMYYTTPHSVTGKTPTELCYGRTIRSKIPSIADVETVPPSEDFRDKDQVQKQKGKEREDERWGAKKSDVSIGDKVLLQNLFKTNKLTPNFGTTEYKVVDSHGSRITVRDEGSGKTIDRNVAHMKKVPSAEKLNTSSDGSNLLSEPWPEQTATQPGGIIQSQSCSPFQGATSSSESHAALESANDLSMSPPRSRRQSKRPARFEDYEMEMN